MLARAVVVYVVFLNHLPLSFLLSNGPPTNLVGSWGERRHKSPNDAGIILCDLVAERVSAMLFLF